LASLKSLNRKLAAEANGKKYLREQIKTYTQNHYLRFWARMVQWGLVDASECNSRNVTVIRELSE
jgi:hypothetical protein